MDTAFVGPARNVRAGYGRSSVADKPSFDGLPPSALAAVPHALVADLVESEWERVESLFESGWYGPCSCLGGTRSSASSPDNTSHPGRSAANPPFPAAPMAEPTSPRPSCSFFGFLAPRPRSDPPRQLHQPLLNGGAKGVGPPLYGAAAAPVPEAPFMSSAAAAAAAAPYGAGGASPFKAVPVPRRAPGMDEADGNALPPALAIDPPQPAATAVRLTPPGPAPAPAGAGTSGSTPVELAPQLGTWADRQYRLLDPVPERCEGGPGSGSGASAPSVSSCPRSPAMRGAPGGGSGADCSGSADCSGAGGSGSGAGGSGSAGGSSSVVAQAPGHYHHQHQHLQPHHGQCGTFHNGNGLDTDAAEVGRRRLSAFQTHQEHALQQQLQLHQQQQHALAAVQEQQRRHAEAEAGDEARGCGADEEALLAEAAWRWRFTRRWQAEQARTGVERAASAGTDHLEEALAYLQTTGATTTSTLSMQIANTSGHGRRGGRGSGGSRRGGGGGAGSLIAAGAGGGMSLSLDGGSLLAAGTLGCGSSTLGNADWPLGASGSGSGSFTRPRLLDRQASGDMLAASREVAALNRRAALVLQQQLDCERQAEQRVQESLAQGPAWVGQHLPVVQIDEWGSFRFIMLKLRDQNSRLAAGAGPGLGLGERQRILVRGHNYGSEGQLMEECNREIMAIARKHGVPFEAPTMMGGGVMEWRRDRDRHLHLHSGFVVDRALPPPQPGLLAGLAGTGAGGVSGPARVGSAVDLLNLAAALARQSFPPTYKITVLS